MLYPNKPEYKEIDLVESTHKIFNIYMYIGKSGWSKWSPTNFILPIHNQFNVGKRWKDWILLAHYTQSHSLPWQVAHQPIRGNRDENIQSHTIIILFEKDKSLSLEAT